MPRPAPLPDLVLEGATASTVVVSQVRGVVLDHPSANARRLDVSGCVVMPALVNAHDHLDTSTLPALGTPPYRSAYDWLRDAEEAAAASPDARAGLAVPLVDRLFLGGLRNLLAGVASVLHHGPFHRSLARDDFPVRVQERYDFALSPGQTPELRKAYRTTDRRIPWLVHAAEGTDERAAGEITKLREANVLRQNTVVMHAVGVTGDDITAMAAARTAVVWSPEMERRLYAATAPVAALMKAGVPIGLGSGAPAAGSRDLLSTLAAAHAESVLSDDDLLAMATTGAAEVARLPVGGLVAGAPADLVVVSSIPAFLAGDRKAIALVISRGIPVYGLPTLMDPAKSRPLQIEGTERRLATDHARRLTTLLRSHPRLRDLEWLSLVRLS